ncbi:hypothetical protein LPJ64_001444 [Coemansia asiatica]|uniref:ER membrane protein complex subunit 1 n=1 Tax=Coemansia asiatica TaxID=1052880 RepID=A0A9W7XLD0_9FUNG|nr:hypothetical protein LPJ64_001444 [Coemansia asiatica]
MLSSISLSKAALSVTLALSGLSSVAFGLFPDEAGRIDWHRAQIGAPTKLIPYMFNATNMGIFAITSRNTLASLDPSNGEIFWRQVFDSDEPIKALRVRDGLVLTLSGNSESHVRVWDASSGSLAWGFSQPPDANFRRGSGAAEFIEGSGDAVAVVGDSFVRLTPEQNTPVWELPLNATASYKRIVVGEKTAFVVGDARPTKKKPQSRLQVVEVDLETGAVVQKYQFANEQAMGSDRLVFLQSKEYGNYVVWREKKSIVWFVHRLGMHEPEWELYHAKLVQVELMPEDMLTSTLHEVDFDPALNQDLPRFAMTYQKDGKTKTVVVEMFLKGDSQQLEMRKVAGFRSDGAVLGSCGIAWPKGHKAVGAHSERAVVAVRSSAADDVSWRLYTDGKTPMHMGKLVYDRDTYGPVVSAVPYYVDSEPRVLIQTSGGLLAALAQGSNAPVWFRDESLAHAADMAFLELAAPVSSAEYAAKATDPSVLGSPVTRFILRWVETLRSTASWVTTGFGIFGPASDASASGEAARSVAEQMKPSSPIVVGDHFGFRKLSILGTSTGVVAALSTQGGVRSWTRFLAENGTAVSIENVFVTRANQAMSSSAPLVTVVGRSQITGNTVVATLNALTGEPVDSGSQLVVDLGRRHAKVFGLPAVDPESNQQLLGFVYHDKQQQQQQQNPQLGIWPSSARAVRAFCGISQPVFFDLGDGSGSTQISGYRALCPKDADRDAWAQDSLLSAASEWVFDLPAGETLISATDYQHGAQSTALLGRVLGDRSVLYKYLNPHLVTLATRIGDSGGIAIYLIDRVSGALLYSTVHANARVTGKQPFLAIQSENRVIYQFWQEGALEVSGAKRHSEAVRGFVTVVADLYESSKPDDRDQSRVFSSYDLLLPHVITSAYVSPEPATALGVTRTGSNISTRDVLFGLASNKLLGLPDQMLDPRRPRNAPTKDEQAEGLVQYAAPLVLDPKRVLSHYNSVAGIRRIASAPTHLESTALVSAYGLDLFFTRTSPSGTFDQLSPSFSKVNLVVTTMALVVGCLLGGPMVRRKLTNQAWA